MNEWIEEVQMILQAITGDVMDFSDMSEEETLEYIENLDPALLEAVQDQLGDPNIEATSDSRALAEIAFALAPIPGLGKFKLFKKLGSKLIPAKKAGKQGLLPRKLLPNTQSTTPLKSSQRNVSNIDEVMQGTFNQGMRGRTAAGKGQTASNIQQTRSLRPTGPSHPSPKWDVNTGVNMGVLSKFNTPLGGLLEAARSPSGLIGKKRTAGFAGALALQYGIANTMTPGLPGSDVMRDDDQEDTVAEQGGLGALTSELNNFGPTPESQEIVKKLAWEGHTVNSANDKFMRVILEQPHVMGATPQDFNTLEQYLANDQDNLSVINVAAGKGREDLADFMRKEWHNIPGLHEQLLDEAHRRFDDFINSSDMDIEVLADISMLSNDEEAMWDDILSGYPVQSMDYLGMEPAGPHSQTQSQNIIEHMEKEFGKEITSKVLSGARDEVIENYITKHTRANPYMITNNEGGMITGFDEAYDTSSFGQVTSLEDLFSGEYGVKVGPVHAASYLKDLFHRTNEGGSTGSSVIASFQQTMYAMGYMDDSIGQLPAPDRWGHVDDQTIKAFQLVQWDIVQNVDEARRLGIEPDVKKLWKEMQNEGVIQRMAESDMDVEGQFRVDASNRFADYAQAKFAKRLVPTMNMPEEEINKNIAEVLSDMTAEERNIAWGMGGNPDEVAMAEEILKSFYNDDSDWGSNIRFGHNNSDFMNYANKVGALTDKEREQHAADLMEGRPSPIGKDVAISNFLMMLDGGLDAQGKRMKGDITTATRDQIRSALARYANTIGFEHSRNNGFTADDIFQRADTGLSAARSANTQDYDELMTTLEGRLDLLQDYSSRGISSANAILWGTTMPRVSMPVRDKGGKAL